MKRQMIISREFVFDAAHEIEGYQGKCGKLHGHTYRLQVSIKGEVQKNGLIIDLKDVKDVVTEKILNRLDHTYLNETIENGSVENVTLWIWDELKSALPLHEIKLWETPGIFTTYSGE